MSLDVIDILQHFVMWTIPTKVRKYKGMKLQRLHHVKLDIDVSSQSSKKKIIDSLEIKERTKISHVPNYLLKWREKK